MYHRIVSGCGQSELHGRILAIDYGQLRVGLAVSDALGLTAQGLPTLVRTSLNVDLGRLAALALKYDVALILVGHPISQSGEETEISKRVVRFAAELGKRVPRPIELWDERMTSREADRSIAEIGMDRRQRRQVRDRVAAQILLQSYLDRRAFERERSLEPVQG